MTTEYIAKIKGDTSELEKALKKVNGSMKSLADDEVLIKLDYDGNIQKFNKVFDSVLKACPDLTIQFQYDANKKLLKQEQNKLKDIEEFKIDVDTNNVSKKIKELAAELNSGYLSAELDDKEVFSKIKYLMSYINTAVAAGAKGISSNISDLLDPDVYSYFFDQIEELLKPRNNNKLKLFDIDENVDKTIENTKNNIDSIQDYMKKLESMGAAEADTSAIEELREEIKILRSDLEDMQEQLAHVSGEAFDELTKSIEETNERLEHTIKQLDYISNKKINFKSLEKLRDLFGNYFQSKNGNQVSDFWDSIIKKINDGDDSLKNLLKDLGLMVDKTEELSVVNTGMVKSGGFIGKDYTILATKEHEDETRYEDALLLKERLEEAAEQGINVAKIIDVIRDKNHRFYLELQETAKGKNFGDLYFQSSEEGYVNPEFYEATTEQIEKLMMDIIKLQKLGVVVDSNASNFIFDKEKGFTLIDLSVMKEGIDKVWEADVLLEELRNGTVGALEEYYEQIGDATGLDKVKQFEEKFNKAAEIVQKSVSELPEAAEEATKKAQQSHSPSVVAEKLGEMWGVGYAEGIKKHKDDVEDAVRELVKAGKLTMQDIIEDQKNINTNDEYKDLVIPVKNVIDNPNKLTTREEAEKRKAEEAEAARKAAEEEAERAKKAAEEEAERKRKEEEARRKAEEEAEAARKAAEEERKRKEEEKRRQEELRIAEAKRKEEEAKAEQEKLEAEKKKAKTGGLKGMASAFLKKDKEDQPSSESQETKKEADSIFKKAESIKELREQYKHLRRINNDIKVYEDKDNYADTGMGKSFIGFDKKKTGSSHEELLAFKKEILELNPLLQQLADSTDYLSESKFLKLFGADFGIDDGSVIKKAEDVGELIDQYHTLVFLNQRMDDVKPDSPLAERIRKEKEEILRLNPLLQEYADHTEEIKKPKELQELYNKYGNNVSPSIDEITRAEREMGEASETASEKIVEGMREAREEIEKTGKTIKEILAYRGTNGEDPVTANKQGWTYWSSSKKVAKMYGTEGLDKTLFSSLLSFENAFEIDAKGAKYGQIVYLGEGADEVSLKMIQLAETIERCQNELKELQKIEESDTEAQKKAVEVVQKYSKAKKEFDKISNDLSNPYGVHSTDWFTKYAELNGYDGVSIKNVIDTPNAYSQGGVPSDIFVTFQRKQLKNIQLLEKANHALAESQQEVQETQLNETASLSTLSPPTISADYEEIVPTLRPIQEVMEEVVNAESKIGEEAQESSNEVKRTQEVIQSEIEQTKKELEELAKQATVAGYAIKTMSQDGKPYTVLNGDVPFASLKEAWNTFDQFGFQRGVDEVIETTGFTPEDAQKNIDLKNKLLALERELTDLKKEELSTEESITSVELTFSTAKTIKEFAELIDSTDLTKKSVEELIEIFNKFQTLEFDPANNDEVGQFRYIGDTLTNQLKELGYEFDNVNKKWVEIGNVAEDSSEDVNYANKSLKELVKLYHDFSTGKGSEEELKKIKSAILDIVQAEDKLNPLNLQKFNDILRGLTFVEGDSPILKEPYDVDKAIVALENLKTLQHILKEKQDESTNSSREQTKELKKEEVQAQRTAKAENEVNKSRSNRQRKSTTTNNTTQPSTSNPSNTNLPSSPASLSPEVIKSFETLRGVIGEINDLLGEKKSLISKEKDEVISNIPIEIKKFEELNEIVNTIILTIVSKTQAIRQERAELVQSVEIELEALKKLAKNSDIPITITTKIDDIIEKIQTAFSSAEFTIDTSSISENVTKTLETISPLITELGKIISLIDEKNASFEKEKQIVDGVVQGEKTALETLHGTLIDIKKEVLAIGEAFKKIPLDKKVDTRWINNLTQFTREDGQSISTLSDALKSVFETLSNLTFPEDNFIYKINDILSKGEELKKLAEVLKSANEKVVKMVKSGQVPNAYRPPRKLNDNDKNRLEELKKEASKIMRYSGKEMSIEEYVKYQDALKNIVEELKRIQTYTDNDNEKGIISKQEVDAAEKLAKYIKEANIAYNGIYLNQKELTTDDEFSYSERKGYYQTLVTNVRKDSDGLIILDQSLTTNFKALEKEIMSTDKTLLYLNRDIEKAKALGADTTPLEESKREIKAYLSALEKEYKNSYMKRKDYVPGQEQKNAFMGKGGERERAANTISAKLDQVKNNDKAKQANKLAQEKAAQKAKQAAEEEAKKQEKITNWYNEKLRIAKEMAKLQHEIAMSEIEGTKESKKADEIRIANTARLVALKEEDKQLNKGQNKYTKNSELEERNNEVLTSIKQQNDLELQIARDLETRNKEREHEAELLRIAAEQTKALADIEEDRHREEIEYLRLREQYIAEERNRLQSEGLATNKQYRKEYEDYEKQREKAIAEGQKQYIDEINKRIKEQESQYEEIWKLKLEIAKLNPTKDGAYIDYLNKQIEAHRSLVYQVSEEIKILKGASSISEVTGNLKSISSLYQSKIEKEESKRVESDRQAKISKLLTEQKNALIEQYNLKQKLFNLDDAHNANEIADIKQQINSLDSIIATKEEEIAQNKQLLDYEEHLSEVTSLRAKFEQGLNTTLVQSMDKYISKLKEAQDKLNAIGENNKYTNSVRDEAKANYESINGLLENVDKINSFDEFTDFKNKVNSALSDYKTFLTQLSSKDALAATELSLSKLSSKLQAFGNNNTAMGKKFRDTFKELESTLSNLQIKVKGGNATEQEIIALQTRINELTADVNKAGQTGNGFFRTLKKQIQSANAQFLKTYFSFQDLIRYGRTAFETIRSLDDALLDLKKTTTMTTADLEDFYHNSSNIAKQLGVTTQEIISQASSWSRLGFSSKEAAEGMAQLSSIFASISPGMTTEESQSGIVSIAKAWGMSTDQIQREVLDNINALGNSFAESNLDLVNGMQRSAAALAAVGEDWRSAFALFTGGQEVLQNSEKMGTALRSISLRIRGYSEQSEDDMLELDDELKNITGDLIDLTKTAAHPMGISIFKDGSTTEFKSLVDYLGEISEIWDEMSQKQQNDFLQKAFAKTQAQSGAAIIQNYDAVKRALEVMENAEGSAAKEMSIVQETISYKLNALKETWVSTLTSVTDRKDFGEVIDFLTTISELLSKIINLGGLSGIFALGANIGIQSFFKEQLDINLMDDIFTLENAKKAGSAISDWWESAKKATEIVIKKNPVNLLDNALALPDVSGDQADSLDIAIEAEERLRAATDTETASRQQNTQVTEQNTIASQANTQQNNAQIGSEESSAIAINKETEALRNKCNALLYSSAATMGYSLEEQDAIVATAGLNGATETNTLEMLRNAAAKLQNKIDTNQQLTATEAATLATLKHTIALQEQNSILYRLKNLFIGGAKQIAFQLALTVLMKVLGAAIKKIKDYIHQEEIMAEKAKAAAEAIKEANDQFKNQKKAVDEIKSEYAELAQGVSGLGTAFQKNESLSTEDYEKFLEYNDRLAELFPELVEGEDAYGHAIIDLKGNVDQINASLDEMLEKYRKINQASIKEKMPDIWNEAYKNSVSRKGDLEQNQGWYDFYKKNQEAFSKFSRNGIIWENKNVREYLEIEQAFKNLGIKNNAAILSTGLFGDKGFNLSALTDAEYNKIEKYFASVTQKYQDEVNKYSQEIQESNKKVATNLKTYFENDNDFIMLPEEFQRTALEIMGNLNVGDLREKGVKTFDDLIDYYYDNIISKLQGIDNKDMEKAMSDVFSGNLDVQSLQDSCNEILDYLVNTLGLTDDNEIIIAIKTKLDESSAKVDRVYQKLFGKAKGINGQNSLSASDWNWIKDTYGEVIGSLTEEQLEQILSSNEMDLSDIYTNFEKVIAKIHEFFQQKVNEQSPIDLKSWLETESSLTDDRGNNKTRQDIFNDYLTLLSTLDGIKEKINNGEEITIGDILGEVPDIYPYIEKYEDFDEAIDHYILDKFDELKEKTGDSSLVQGGAEFFSKYIDETNKVLKTKKINPIFNSEATVSDAVQHYEQSTELWLSTLSSSYDKIFESGKFNYKKIDKDVIKGIKDDFKNVEKSLHIDIPDDDLNKFIHVISNSKTTTQQAQEAFNKYATTMFYAADGTKDLNEETADLMTKLLKDNGIVNADEVVSNYISHQSKLQTTVKKNSELYKQNQSDIQKINELKQQQAHASNEEATALENEIQAIQNEVNARLIEMAADQEAADKLFELQLTEEGISLDNIDSSKDVAEIAKIAAACGSTIASLNSLQAWEADLKSVETTVSSANYLPTDAVKGMKDAVNKKNRENYEKEVEEQAKSYTSAFDKIKFGPSASALDSAGGAGEEIADAIIEGYNKELEVLKWLRDQGFITEKEYLDQLRVLYQKHFQDREKYAKEYYEAEREYLEGVKSYYESAIQSAINILDRQIKKYEDLRDAEKKVYEDQIKANEKLIKSWEKKTKAIDKQIKALEREKKAIEKNYIKPLEKEIKFHEKRISNLQKELEEIQKANEAREDALNLQRSLYELERARNQRVHLVYNGDQGMVYRADDEAVREKRQAYEEALYQHRIKLYQDQIDAIQKQVDLLNEKIDEYNESIEKIDEEIERLEEIKEGYQDEIDKLQEKNEKLEEAIQKIDDYYQALIDGVNEYKKQWEELLEIEKEAQDLANLESLGIDPNGVLNLDPAAFETMKQNYLSVLTSYYQENELMLNELSKVTGESMVETQGYLEKTEELFQRINGLDLETIDKGIESARAGVDTVVEGLNTAVTNFGGLSDSGIITYGNIQTAGAAAWEHIEKAGNTANSALETGTNKVKEAIDALPVEVEKVAKEIQDKMSKFEATIKVNYDTSSSPTPTPTPTPRAKGTVGNAFAEGTGYPGLTQAETALRSEYGQPELTVYPNGHYELTTQPTLSDLPKDTVIFNEEQTKRILNNGKKSKGKAYAKGTAPLAAVMPNKAELFSTFEAQLLNNVFVIADNTSDMRKNINGITSSILSNASTINNGGDFTINGGVNITCPGVTSKEVTEDIAKQLNDVFFGMATNAYQRSMNRK